MTRTHILEFQASSSSRMAVKLLGRALEGNLDKGTMEQTTCVGDFLITTIHIGNAARTGLYINMQLKEFQEATLHKGKRVIMV